MYILVFGTQLEHDHHLRECHGIRKGTSKVTLGQISRTSVIGAAGGGGTAGGGGGAGGGAGDGGGVSWVDLDMSLPNPNDARGGSVGGNGRRGGAGGAPNPNMGSNIVIPPNMRVAGRITGTGRYVYNIILHIILHIIHDILY